MHYECKAETGAQLLARLGSRPSVKGLDQGLIFTNDSCSPNCGDILEISGDHSTGKTLLITQILSQCLLPIKVKVSETDEIHVGGLEAGAILIITDHHFQISKLVQIMEQRLSSSFCSQPIESKISEEIEKVTKNSLRNLLILNCYDSAQLFATFYSLEKYLSANQSIAVVALDSASAFYWQDMSSNNCMSKRMDSYLKSLVSTLEKCVREFKILTIFTRPRYFHSKNPLPSKNSGGGSSGPPTFKVELTRPEGEEDRLSSGNDKNSTPFRVHVHTPSSTYMHNYFITSDGIMSKQKS